MAINRQDYQYIRNTIPGQQNKISNGVLAVGEKVTNLLPELKETNIYNPNYTEYYGSLESNTGKWAASSDTTKTGLLSNTVTLEPNTTYVLQVVGATKPKNTTLPSNSIRLSDQNVSNTDIDFDQYLFFNTGNTTNCELKIYGLGFGYKILGEKQDGSLCQLRTFISPSQAKVYLFKADIAWVVNKEGVITNVGESMLYSISDGDSEIPATFSLEEAKKLFTAAPVIGINNGEKKISVYLPECLSTNTTWKYYKNWQLLGDDINKIRLIVCRNFLTSTTRDYCNKTNEFQSSVKSGILRTIQKTKNGFNDTYCTVDLTQFPNKSIRIQFRTEPLNLNPSSTSVDFIWPSEKKKLPISIDSAAATTPYSLELFSLLGYNETHCTQNNIVAEKYKYTSISFAWGLVQEDDYGVERIVECISDLSNPIIIDRNAINISYDVNNDAYIIEPKACSISRKISGYTNKKQFYIDVVETTSE